MNNSGVLNQPSFQGNASYPSPSSQPQQQSSPRLQVHRNISSPHAFSPSSPNSTSTLHHQPQQKSQLPLPPNAPNAQNMNPNLNSNMSQTQLQNSTGCWSNLPPNMSNNQMQMRTGMSAGMSTSTSAIGNGSNNVNAPTGITLKLMQEQNPILNAQLSQDSISYVQIQPSHPQNTNNPQQHASSLNSSNQSLPPSSNSPSLNSGLSMRFNRNSPVLTATSSGHLANSQQAQPQYPSSPNFMNSSLNNNNLHSPTQQLNRNQMGQMQPAAGQQRLQSMQVRTQKGV